jgi:hypothetical protein
MTAAPFPKFGNGRPQFKGQRHCQTVQAMAFFILNRHPSASQAYIIPAFSQVRKRPGERRQTMSEPENNAALVDIRDVRVDSSLPKQERVAEYLRQIKNPSHYMCLGWEIEEKRAGQDAPSIEDCLERIVGMP